MSQGKSRTEETRTLDTIVWWTPGWQTWADYETLLAGKVLVHQTELSVMAVREQDRRAFIVRRTWQGHPLYCPVSAVQCTLHSAMTVLGSIQH